MCLGSLDRHSSVNIDLAIITTTVVAVVTGKHINIDRIDSIRSSQRVYIAHEQKIFVDGWMEKRESGS